LRQDEAIDAFLDHFRNEIEFRLRAIYNGLIGLKNEGLPVDAIAPEGAIYLTVKVEAAGKKTSSGLELKTQADVTEFLLNEAKLAIVPFYAFGAAKNSPWYRLSVGTCKKEEINEMLDKLRNALKKIHL
jgi:aspartate aminotransferase